MDTPPDVQPTSRIAPDRDDPSPSFRPVYLAGMAVIFMVLLIWYASPDRRFVRIHDFLDSNFPRAKILAEHDLFFAPLGQTVAPLLNGAPRDALQSQFKLVAVPYMLLAPVGALILNEFLSRFFAYAGMLLFLKTVLGQRAEPTVITPVATLFALLPFYPGDPYAQAALPLGGWAALNLAFRRRTGISLLIFLLLPLAGSFAFASPSYFVLSLVPMILPWLRRDRPPAIGSLSPILLIAGFLLTDYRLFHLQFFQEDFISHRTEFHVDPRSWLTVPRQAAHFLLFGQYHFPSLHAPVILLAVLSSGVMLWRRGETVLLRYTAGLLLLCVPIALIYALQPYLQAYPEFFGTLGLGPLASFAYGRVHALATLLWYVLFALSLVGILTTVPRRFSRALMIILILGQFGFIWRASHWDTNRRKYRHTVAEFYSEPLFEEIKTHIGVDPSEYRVITVGLMPAIALYNGFYCLDGYAGSYDLEYKHRFREIIALELAKDESIRRYFDDWGNCAYIYTSELKMNFLISRDHDRELHDWSFDADAFHALGGRYVLSAVPIRLHPGGRLVLERSFERDESPWRIWLYRVDPPSSPPESVATDSRSGPVLAASGIDFAGSNSHHLLLSPVL